MAGGVLYIPCHFCSHYRYHCIGQFPPAHLSASEKIGNSILLKNYCTPNICTSSFLPCFPMLHASKASLIGYHNSSALFMQLIRKQPVHWCYPYIGYCYRWLCIRNGVTEVF